MKDYYKILGVKEGASEEEIRARWIELTKRDHPDLGETEKGNEKMREINEAYEVLKDESARSQYDYERDLKRSIIKRAHRRQERRTNTWKIIVVPCLGLLVLFFFVDFFLLRSSRFPTPARTGAKTEALREKDKGPGKKIGPVTPPAKTDARVQEETRAPKEIEKPVIPPESKGEVTPREIKEMASVAPQKSPTPGGQESEQKKEPPRKVLPESNVPASALFAPPAKKESESKGKPATQVVMKSERPVAKEVSREVPKETPKPVAKEIPKEVPREVPKEVPKVILKEVAEETPKEIPKPVAKEAPKEVPKEVPKEAQKQLAKEIVKKVPKEPTPEVPKEAVRVTLHPGETLTLWPEKERAASSSPSLLAKEEEVKQFFSNYVDRYHQRDVAGFLSLFSPSAIQNQTDRSGAMKTLYTKFFNESEELRYQMEGMTIKIYPERIDVRARYRVDQKLKKAGAEKVWKGDIRWVLVKEEGRLKIISLDHQNDKSP